MKIENMLQRFSCAPSYSLEKEILLRAQRGFSFDFGSLDTGVKKSKIHDIKEQILALKFCINHSAVKH